MSQQLSYYGLDGEGYKREYLSTTLDRKREQYKNECRLLIARRIQAMEADSLTKEMSGQVERLCIKYSPAYAFRTTDGQNDDQYRQVQ
ncbi:hypothetical protein [Chitinophaga pinensis]|uniref:Uncharacterized protein n=1 Tax=Chitinophaga pinensis TaxID=79329 RepID=A0A5C6LYP1_9BACT|nr:hypothetical protein [Chitinophaga pinensis]TWW01914.1 hypothetical protein FEF09_04945 [Chitinophaga pinensis]